MTQTRPPHALTVSRPDRAEVARVATAELAAWAALLADLAAEDWRRPTASGWTVREMIAHVVGQQAESARPWTIGGKIRRARRRYPAMSSLDAHNALQVAEYGTLTPAELTRTLATLGVNAVRSRRRTPGLVRRQSALRYFPEEPLIEPRLGYVIDVLSNRDTWMHRVEIARATGRAFLAGEHDKAVVAQVVLDLALEWAGPAIELELSGALGGTWGLGRGKPIATVRVETLDYLWLLSGRVGRPALDIDGDREVAGPVLDARVVF